MTTPHLLVCGPHAITEGSPPGGRPVASLEPANLLTAEGLERAIRRLESARADTSVGGTPRLPLVVRAGWHEDDETGFETWGPRGRDAGARALESLLDAAAGRGGEVWLCPAAWTTVSDVPSIVAIMRRLENMPLRLLLQPAALLTPAMLADAEDHLTRTRGALAGHPKLAAVVCSGVPSPRSEWAPPLAAETATGRALLADAKAWASLGATLVLVADDQGRLSAGLGSPSITA